MKQSEIISLGAVSVCAIALLVSFIQKYRKETTCEYIRDKMEGCVYCWRCKYQEPVRRVCLAVDGKTSDGNAFIFADIYTYKHLEPFEAYAERDGARITKLRIGKFPGARYENDEEE